MANLLDRFKTNVIGSKGSIADYIANINPSSDFTRITDFDVILESWTNILMTPKRTYTFDPEYSSAIYKYIFEPADEETIASIKNEVIQAITTYDNRAKITSVTVNFLPNRKGFSVSIIAKYKNETKTLSVDFKESDYFKFLRTS